MKMYMLYLLNLTRNTPHKYVYIFPIGYTGFTLLGKCPLVTLGQGFSLFTIIIISFVVLEVLYPFVNVSHGCADGFVELFVHHYFSF